MARKLKMTKKCVAARRRYRAKKKGVPARRRRGAGTFMQGGKTFKSQQAKKRARAGIKPVRGKRGFPLKRRRIDPGKYNLMTGKMGSGLRSNGPPKRKYVIAGKKRYPLKRMVRPTGSGLRRKRRGRGRGRGRGPRGAGWLEDVGHFFEGVGQVALQALPFVAAIL